MNRNHLLAVAGAATLAGLAVLAAWGPLDPPDGPIAPTYKTLTEVEPRVPVNAQNTPGDGMFLYKISQPGSYYLTGSFKSGPSQSGILIEASSVTLDLCGFTVEGPHASTQGISCAAADNVTIKNGVLHSWRHGVGASSTKNFRLSNLSVSGSSSEGFRVPPGAIVSDCLASGCSEDGFDVIGDATLTNCRAIDNSWGFGAGDGTTLINCAATGCNLDGFRFGSFVVAIGCTAHANGNAGFLAEESTVLTDCSATENGSIGFNLGARARATRCLARANTTGFTLTEAGALVECTASAGTSDGIRINGNANSVERCTVHENAGNGVLVATGRGNSIDGNLATYNTLTGIKISDTDNLMVHNRARGNAEANYSVIANSDYGVILTNPGAGFTSSAAWANFAY